MTAAPTQADADRRVECYLRDRPAAVAGPVRSVRDRLRSLRESDVVDDVRYEAWPPERPADDESAESDGRRRGDLVTELERWADRRGYSLDPAFRRRRSAPLHAPDETYERVRVPLITVLVYEDGDLVTVAPCADGGGVVTVDDCLSALESASDVSDRPDGDWIRAAMRPTDG